MKSGTNKIKNFLLENDEIILDTSSIMEFNRFKMFVNYSYKILLENNKFITILWSVWSELITHSNSCNHEKRNKAKNAIDLIKNYPNIFLFESNEASYNDKQNVFADRDILSRLMNNKIQKKTIIDF